ncbi:putative rta1-like protein [Moniliophthora roreri]|nr:putative rta1-like protein [Moniliophthora roreri]
MFELGSNLVLAGIAFQAAIMTVFVALVAEYVVRYICDKPVGSSRKQNVEFRKHSHTNVTQPRSPG